MVTPLQHHRWLWNSVGVWRSTLTMLMALALALTVAGSAALAQQKVPADTIALAKKVASANTFAIQSSELAQERAQSSEVKSFAKRMIEDHTKAREDFKSALQAANISPPPPVRPDARQRAALLKLRSAQGSAFDRAYVTAQLKGHKAAVSLLRNYAKHGRTAQLKELAQKTLPTLEEHLSLLQELSSRGVAGGQGRTGTGSRAIGPPAEKAPPRNKNR
jgi:putative membrane protein